MSDWTIETYHDLKKIPDLSLPESKVAEFKAKLDYSDVYRAELKHRIAKLRRMKLIKGDTVTPFGRQFVEHCLQHYGDFKGKLALSHSTTPTSYPEVEKEGLYRNETPDYYYEALGLANDELCETVFECEGMLNDRKELTTALDINARFGRYFHRRNAAGEDVRYWCANWDSYGGNGWGANDQWLVSDYDKDHFHDLLENGDWAPEILNSYESQAEAFADVYYELWALYVWSVVYGQMTSSDELMYRWRWNLASGYESRCEDIWQSLCLTDLTKALRPPDAQPPLGWIGPVSDPREYGAESDANFEALEAYVSAIERLVAAYHAEVADLMRAHGSLVVKTAGTYKVALKNGEVLDHRPFYATAKELLTRPADKAFPFDSPLAVKIRSTVAEILDNPDVAEKMELFVAICPAEENV